MRASRFSLPAAIVLALGLSACQAHQPLVPTSEVSYVGKVNVRLDPKVTSTRIAERVRTRTLREGTRYGVSGRPKHLDVNVTLVHYKNPALSLLVGDGNRIQAHVKVSDGASGQSHGEFLASASNGRAINGVIGAVIAATQDQDAVEQELADQLASDVLERVYGSAAAEEARKRAPAEVVEAPAAAPAPGAAPAAKPKPKPVAPKSVPVATSPAKAEPRTAMATGLTPAAR